MAETLDELARRLATEWPERLKVLDKFDGSERAQILVGMLAGDIGLVLNSLRLADKLDPLVEETVHNVIRKRAAGKPLG